MNYLETELRGFLTMNTKQELQIEILRIACYAFAFANLGLIAMELALR